MPADAPTAALATSSLAVSMPASSRTPHSDTRPRPRGAILGGLTLAIVSFSVAAPVGTLAVAPLGPRYTGLGVVIGLTAAIFGGLVASLVARSATLKTDPITATAVLWSAALAQVRAPQLAYKLLLTLACNLSSHLRDTTDELRELER